MNERFCITAREAAEMVNLSLTKVMHLSKSDNEIGRQVDGVWRVDISTLTAAISRDRLAQAA